MVINAMGLVQYVNDKSVKDEETGKEEQYVKTTIRDIDSGQFVSFNSEIQEYYEGQLS